MQVPKQLGPKQFVVGCSQNYKFDDASSTIIYATLWFISFCLDAFNDFFLLRCHWVRSISEYTQLVRIFISNQDSSIAKHSQFHAIKK